MSQNNSLQPVSASKSTAFVRLLGLQNDPFNAASSAHYYYEDELLQETFNLVLKLLESPPRLVLIVGPPGSGISSFLSQLALRANSKYRVIRPAVGSHVKPGLWRTSIMQVFETTAPATEQALLLLDQGENIEPQMLSLVAQFSGNADTSLACVVGATTTLLDQLDSGECPLRIGINAHLIRLRPFTLEQTTAYINQRLAAAGMRVPFTLTDVEIARIHKQANGLPARVNTFAQRALKDAKTLKQIRAVGRDFRTSETTDTTFASHPFSTRNVLGASLLLLLLSFLAWHWFPDARTPDSVTVPHQNVPIAAAPEPVLAPIIPDKNQIPLKTPETVEAPELALVPKPRKTPEQETIPAPNSNNKSKPASVPSTRKVPMPENSAAPIPRKKPTAPLASTTVKKPVLDKPLTPRPSTATITTNATATNTPPVKVKTRVHKSPPPSQAEVVETTVALGGLQSQDWLLKQNPSHFTLQLTSAPQRNTLVHLARMHLLKPQGATYTHYVNKRPWHVLIVGVFPSADEATQAILQLPDALRDPPPRVRSLRQIQKEIRRGTAENLPRKPLAQ